MIVFLCASGKGKFSGIFGIGGAEYKSAAGSECLDQQGDQFAGTVAGQDVFRRYMAVFGDGTAQAGVFPVRVG